MKRFMSIIAVSVLAFAGCKKDNEAKPDETAKTAEPGGTVKPTQPTAPADGLVAIPNSNGLVAKVPAGAKPNGIGGAAGFHSDDGSFEFMVMETSAEEAAKTIEENKAGKEEVLFKKWVRADKTADGWVMVYEMPKLDLNGDEPKEVGTITAVEVRRAINGKTHTCSAGLEKPEGVDAVIEACNSIKSK